MSAIVSRANVSYDFRSPAAMQLFISKTTNITESML